LGQWQPDELAQAVQPQRWNITRYKIAGQASRDTAGCATTFNEHKTTNLSEVAVRPRRESANIFKESVTALEKLADLLQRIATSRKTAQEEL
jgi:hypothetical protein